jgi:tetratricopeptide (TPR) repeat protein
MPVTGGSAPVADNDGHQPLFLQNVTAVSGFAYGVIGADIHVFDNGLPLYLLAERRPEADADAEWLRELPSRMLNARRAVVPFTGRAAELADLRAWRDGGRRLAVRWMHGPGGQGKTRLASQLAAESAAAGWKVIEAFHGSDADRPEPGSQDLGLTGKAGLLVIADYADRWPLTSLTWFFKNALLHHATVPTRVLLVARTADAWPPVRGILDVYQASTSAQALEALPPDSGERERMFSAAANRFAAIYQMPGPPAIEAPAPLDDPESGLTLALQMAALVAVDAVARGKTPVRGMAAWTMYLLDREQLHWARLYDDRSAAEDGRWYLTPPEVMNRVVYAAVLTGALPRAAGVEALERIEIAGPEHVLDDHAVSYPPAAAAEHESVLIPLYPDRLAEDFLALTMPGHQAEYPAREWAAPAAAKLLGRSPGRAESATWTARSITFLASAAHRWPHVGPGCLYPLLLADPLLAVEAGSAALVTIAGLPGLDQQVIEAIEARFPERPPPEIMLGVVSVTRRLAEFRLSRSARGAEHGEILHQLGMRLLQTGQGKEALPVLAEAETIFREYQRRQPVIATRNLAVVMALIGRTLVRSGEWADALEKAQEAVALLDRLAGTSGDSVAADRATARTLLSEVYAGLGRWADALRAVDAAIDALRELSSLENTVYDNSLAQALKRRGAYLWELGLRADSLRATEEAVALYENLPEADLAVNESGLAELLDNRAAILARAGRPEEALPPAAKSVEIFRRLTRINRATFGASLGRALTNMALSLANAGNYQRASDAMAEAVSIFQSLARADPVEHEPALAEALDIFAGPILAKSGQLQDALPRAEQSVALYRRLAVFNKQVYEPRLAGALLNLAAIYHQLDRSEAAGLEEQAADLLRPLARGNLVAHGEKLATALTSLSLSLAESRQPVEAIATIEEAIVLWERLADAGFPHAVTQEEACLAYMTLTRALNGAGREPDFLAALKGLLERLAPQTTALPADSYDKNLGEFLHLYSSCLNSAGRWQDAVTSGTQAVAVLRRPSLEDVFSKIILSASLANLGFSFIALNQVNEAHEVTAEAIEIRREISRANIILSDSGLGGQLNNLGFILYALERYEEALQAVDESLEEYQRLETSGSYDYTDERQAVEDFRKRVLQRIREK